MDKDKELKERVARVNYLIKRASGLVKVNPEQAEAYIVRIKHHKSKILVLLKESENR